jgi:Amt family ammonium transporter
MNATRNETFLNGVDFALVRELLAEQQDLRVQLKALQDAAVKDAALDRDNGIETGWLAICTALVMFMQLGFALVESGSVRTKNYRHVLLKNIVDFSVGIMLWYSIGYWIAFPNMWDGMDIDNIADFNRFEPILISANARIFFLQAVFAPTCVTIVSGTMAERTRLEAYLMFVALCGGILYSVVVRWTWGGGWLSQLEPPYHDCAGSGIVHTTGGIAGLVGSYMVGPRAGRFEKDALQHEIDTYRPHSYDNVVSGTMILWFGWFGFNSGSTASILSGNADDAATSFLNTLLCPCFSALVALGIQVVRHMRSRLPEHERPTRFDLGRVCNAILGGLVGITGGCDVIPSEYTPVMGLLLGSAVYCTSDLMIYLRVDDPVDAVAVHGACGIIGVLCVGLFDRNMGLVTTGNHEQLIVQLIGVAVIVCYVGGTAFVYFYIVDAYGFLRMNMAVEVMGIDFAEIGDGVHQDVTELELLALQNYRKDLLDRMSGDVWGLSEDAAIEIARTHRNITTFFLTSAIVYNFFFYAYFEWRSWEFYACVNLCVGFQSAAAAHAEFKCKPGELKIRILGAFVTFVNILLAGLNFFLATSEDGEGRDLRVSWALTFLVLFLWSFWMHLRVHPLDWEEVCFSANVQKSNHPYLRAMFGLRDHIGLDQWIIGIICGGRLQHIFECTVAVASITGNMWVGLDEAVSGGFALGVTMVCFSCMQSIVVIGKIVVPTGLRSLHFVQAGAVLTFVSEAPLMVLIIFTSGSDIKYIAVGVSAVALVVQIAVAVLFIVKYHKEIRTRREARQGPTELPATVLKNTNTQSKAGTGSQTLQILDESVAAQLGVTNLGKKRPRAEAHAGAGPKADELAHGSRWKQGPAHETLYERFHGTH